MECEFCKKILNSISSLNNHKKTTKYCLEIQGKKEVIEFICQICNKTFTSKQMLNKHIKSCTSKNINNDYIKELEQLKEENKKLKEENEQLKKEKENLELRTELKIIKSLNEKNDMFIKDIAIQPKFNTNTTNKILNITSSLDLNKDKIKDILLTEFDKEYILDGQKSLAHFTLNNILKDENGNLSYICTDPSRQIFKYKDTTGEIIKDIKATKLTNVLVDSELKKLNCTKADELWTNDDGTQNTEKFIIFEPKINEINNINNDNTVFVKELAKYTTI